MLLAAPEFRILDLEIAKIDPRRGTQMNISLAVLAGFASTIIFAISTLPMLLKAYRTRDLSSYSLGNILLANVGNLVHSVYIFALPPGPIWLLHAFYVVSTALMLIWYLRYEWRTRRAAAPPPAQMPLSHTPSGAGRIAVDTIA